MQIEDPLKAELLGWIKLLHAKCLELNEALIQAFELEKQPRLMGRDRYAFPVIAAIDNLLPRQGTIKGLPVTYSVHGGGITFVMAEQVVVSFEYYPQVSHGFHPLLGCYGVSKFIHSSNPVNPLGDERVVREYALELIQDGALVRLDEAFFQFYVSETATCLLS